jgi:hypothetical protein
VRRADTEAVELTMLAFNARTGQQRALVSQRVGPDFAERAQVVRSMVAVWLDHVVRQLASAGEPEVVSPAPAAPPAPPVREGKPAWYRRWQVWAIAGGVLAAGVVTTALVARNGGQSSTPPPPDTGTLVLEF